MEAATMKQELQDHRMLCNNLQLRVVQYKNKIRELQDVIMQVTKIDMSGGNEAALSSVLTQKQELKAKLLESIEVNQKLEQENELLRKQIIELNDLSFAKGAFISQGGRPGSVRASANFDILNASSIERAVSEDNETINIPMPLVQENEKILQ